jgi:alpha,alpha-trehalase
MTVYLSLTLQLAAVEGLRRYGRTADADPISREFLSLVLDQYRQHGIIVEKYDAVRRSMYVSPGIRFGYSSNEGGLRMDKRRVYGPVR